MNILFLCVFNSARSQMTEGLARRNFQTCRIIFKINDFPATIFGLFKASPAK